MSLAGQAAVAIWHDIEPQARQAFYAWHGREHMPERVGIPGFLRGRRYVAVEGAPEYFNLYEVDTHATLTGPDYLARLNAPTPWTAATVAHFRNVARSLCTVAASAGEGEGGLIATLRYDVDDDRAAAHRARVVRETLPGVADAAGVAGAHLLVTDAAASAVETAEKRVRNDRNAIPRWVVLIEGWGDAEPFRAYCRALRDSAFADASGLPLLGVYVLQNARTRVAR